MCQSSIAIMCYFRVRCSRMGDPVMGEEGEPEVTVEELNTRLN